MKIVLSSPGPFAVEPLEARIAPASLIFTDLDGDTVTITTNKGSDAQLEAAAHFSGVDPAPRQLQELNLGENPVFAGASVNIDATANGGDGSVNVGYINATGIDLARVVVDGDLGRIDAGDRNFSTPGIGLLEVQSIGSFGVTTQALGGTLLSTVKGSVGSLLVHGNFKEAQFEIAGNLGKMEIDGSVLGGALEKSGSIRAAGIKNVTVTGSLIGGSGVESGRLSTGSKLLNVTVNGGIVGGDGDNSGQLAARRVLQKITVNAGITGGAGIESGGLATSGQVFDVTINGDIIGASGTQSGEIAATGNITKVTLNGSLLGGSGIQSASIGSDKAISGVHITGDVVGGMGASAGQIVSKRTIRAVTIDGSLIGGAQFETGSIGSLRGLNDITIGTDIVAGTGERSGLIVCDALPNAAIGTINVLGSIKGTPLTGIAGLSSGGILGGHTIALVEVGANILGGNSPDAGSIRAVDGIKRVLLHGDLQGGTADNSGSIHGTFKVGTIVIDGSIRGGDGFGSGAVLSETTIAAVTVHGSVFGGKGAFSGRVESDGDLGAPGRSSGDMGKVIVDGAVQGGEGFNSGLIFSSGALTSAQIGTLVGGLGFGSGTVAAAGNIGELVTTGDVTGSAADEAGKIFAGGDIKTLTIGGALRGGAGNFQKSRSDVSEVGQIFAGGTIGELSVVAIVGDEGNYTAHVRAAAINNFVAGSVRGGAGIGSGAVIADETDLDEVVITGDLSAGTGALSGHIGAARKIGSLSVDRTIGNDLIHALITAGGMVNPKNDGQAVAIDGVTIFESTTFADILAGYDVDGNAVNPDVQIGAIVVGGEGQSGDWTATSVAAGATAGADGFFGTGDDGLIFEGDVPNEVLSRIARVIINGEILPSPNVSAADQYGIVAEHVVAVTLGGAAINLAQGPRNDALLIGTSKDMSVIEIGGGG